MKRHIRRPLGALTIAAALAFPVAAAADTFQDIADLASDIPSGTRLDRDQSRRCFVALQDLLDGEASPETDRLARALDRVCYEGISSELERYGLFFLLAEAGHEVFEARAEAGSVDRRPDERTFPSQREADAFRLAVMSCWNIGALSPAAIEAEFVVGLTIVEDGRPEAGSIELLESSAPSQGAAQQAFEAARRAIIRCGANGFSGVRPGFYQLSFFPGGLFVPVEE